MALNQHGLYDKVERDSKGKKLPGSVLVASKTEKV
jgi:hypothetical protein